MRKRLITLLFFAIILWFHFPAQAQLTPEEVAERAKWEEFLETAEIIEQEQIGGREAVTEPWKLTLQKDGVVRYALWKNPEGRLKGSLESWKHEIAAYRLDKYLGLNMVPPTVERRFQENRGSCQLWLESEMNMRQKIKKKVETPPHKILDWMRSAYLQQAFDNLIANEDRHLGNVLITKDWRTILVDHSRTFRTSKKFTKKLIYTDKRGQPQVVMMQLPRAFVDKIMTLNFESIKNIVGEYLTDIEINAVLIRKDLLLKEISERIKKYGEDKVLY